MLGLAVAALVLVGWRKNARATARTPRREPIVRKPWVPVGVAETTVPLYKRSGPFRRVWAIVASSGIAIVIGVVVAVVVSFGLAMVVITLTDLLKQ